MSQSNDPLAPCVDEGEHGEATISLCDALRSGARGRKKRNLVTVGDDCRSSDGAKEELVGVENGAAIIPIQ